MDGLVIVISVLVVAWCVGGETIGLRSLAEASVAAIRAEGAVYGGVFCADNVLPGERFRGMFVEAAEAQDLWVAPDENGDYCTRRFPSPEGGHEAGQAMAPVFRVWIRVYGGVAHVQGYCMSPDMEGVGRRCGRAWNCWLFYTGRGWVRTCRASWVAVVNV